MKKIITLLLVFALGINLFSIPVLASDENDEAFFRGEIIRIYPSVPIAEPGNYTPYTWDSMEKVDEVAAVCFEAACDSASTPEELETAYQTITNLPDLLCISDSYAENAYALALEESNDDGWYDEGDWNDFEQKRDALRVALKRKDENEASNAYRDMYASFKIMTTRYNIAGDLNKDGKANILDVTLLQKHVAKMITLNSAQMMLAKCYFGTTTAPFFGKTDDGNLERITIVDATSLQKSVALYSGYELDNSPDNLDRFISVNDYGDEFNFFLFTRFDDSREWVYNRVDELRNEGII